jgi:DNA-binding GntR family transcriptional regulator
MPDRARLHWLNAQLRVAADRGEHAHMADINIHFHTALCEAAHNDIAVALRSGHPQLVTAVSRDNILLAGSSNRGS